MERNRWETAIRCLEVAVHPNTRDDEMIAAVNGFRRTADGLSLSQICLEFACGGVPLSELARMKTGLERLDRENRELRRKLAVDEAAQVSTASRLDAAYKRVHELTEELLAAQRHADAAEQEFAQFRAHYARVVDGMSHENHDLRSALDDARRNAAQRQAQAMAPSFATLLTEAKSGAERLVSLVNDIGSGKLSGISPNPDQPWTA